jgi:hypothetical protein
LDANLRWSILDHAYLALGPEENVFLKMMPTDAKKLNKS